MFMSAADEFADQGARHAHRLGNLLLRHALHAVHTKGGGDLLGQLLKRALEEAESLMGLHCRGRA